MLARHQVEVFLLSIERSARGNPSARKLRSSSASLVAAVALAASTLPVAGFANEQPSLAVAQAREFDSRALLTQAAIFDEFRTTAPLAAARDAEPDAQPFLALSRDFVEVLEQNRTDGDARSPILSASERSAQLARRQAIAADVARADAARAAVRLVEQRAASRAESQRRSVARSNVRPPLKLSDEQLNIARFVAERYRVSFDEIQHFVAHAYDAAREFRLDPHLVLAVVGIESSFNPKARSNKGAQGLMQVMTRVHSDKFAPFGGPSAAFDPVANLRVGSRILKEYLVREGSVEGALKSYVGAALLKHDHGYGRKVLTERNRIAAAAEPAGETGLAANERGAGTARGEAARSGSARAGGNGGYVKVAANRFGDSDSAEGGSAVQRLLDSRVGY